MITVTERAKQALLDLKSAENISQPDTGMRLKRKAPGALGLYADREQAGDQVVTHKGSTVLLIGAELSGVLAGATLDCKPTAEGSELVILSSERSNSPPS